MPSIADLSKFVVVLERNQQGAMFLVVLAAMAFAAVIVYLITSRKP